MWVVVEMDGGYSGDDMYVSQLFGPFKTEKEAEEWLRTTKRRYGYSVHEVIPYQ